MRWIGCIVGGTSVTAIPISHLTGQPVHNKIHQLVLSQKRNKTPWNEPEMKRGAQHIGCTPPVFRRIVLEPLRAQITQPVLLPQPALLRRQQERQLHQQP